ncbi:MAG: HPr(Ser) kinase/phosphatase [Bacillota bacterium]|uniref:HPr kinase/phosphorylase n=1 Tax=[Clostridium] aminophilum TaxID=1526 RepID=A0A1I0A124_9FIRM|nr:HPr(Ser) kinase/phosphatase [[Clostridium] aminophilum]MDT3844773.1 HPr(Ser) kinase/phosphatase [Bacillota bacterium]SES87738.1 Hpr(Ser) kinase/phosphatase [[Clostridium] aminophilum]
MADVTITELIDKLGLKNMTPQIDTDLIVLKNAEVNRPALQLTGYLEHFDSDRVQVIGNVETAYTNGLPDKKRLEVFEKLLASGIPCLLYSRGIEPADDIIGLCEHYEVPCLMSEKPTSHLMAEIILWLTDRLAPMISVHGVLVDVAGVGVLIMGESGIGKSEAALELIKRGHRLVSDDVVEIRRTSDSQLIGTSPDITRYFIELRGIGVIDVKTLFGVQSVKDQKTIDMVIKLEEWDKEKEYDRLGLEDQFMEFLGNKVVCHSIPIRPGRNLAIIVESAAVNQRQKGMGYNTAQELYRRVQEAMVAKTE